MQKLLLACLSFFPMVGQAQKFFFQRDIVETYDPHFVQTADLDGDGDKDILSISSSFRRRIVWQENLDGNGDFGHFREIDANIGLFSFGLAASDLDSDGDLDVAATSSSGEIGWYENTDGAGSFSSFALIASIGNANPTNFFSLDFDLDGFQDLLIDDNVGQRLVLLKNENATGSFSVVTLATVTDPFEDIFPADMDGDGDLDIGAIHNTASNIDEVVWYANLFPTISLGNKTLVTTSSSPTGYFSIEAADMDGDGHKDLLAGKSNTLAWFRNTDGLGTFEAQPLVTDTEWLLDMQAADLDGDGDVDVACPYQWIKNLGNGDFEVVGILPPPNGGNALLLVHVDDLDGDGDMDILEKLPELGRLTWFANTDGNGNFSFLKDFGDDVERPKDASPADLDGEGDLDILIASEKDNKASWYENLDGKGKFGFQQIITTSVREAALVTAGDLDADGDLDVVAAGKDSIYWCQNTDGQGSFGTQQLVSTDGGGAYSLDLVDMDGDGDLDVFSASIGGFTATESKVRWFENLDGQGLFSPPHLISSPGDLISNAFAGDLDNDGDVDVLGVSYDLSEISWYINGNGLGAFSAKIPIDTNIGIYEAVIVDLDQDGWNDVVTSLGWLKNMGSPGAFAFQSVLSLDDNILVADLDLDGDLDIITKNNLLPRVLLNDGNQQFSILNNYIPGGNEVQFHALADLDGDSDFDLVANFSQTANVVSWYKNAAVQSSWLTGAIFHDTLENCQYDMPEIGLANWVVRADNADGLTYFDLTGPSGGYALPVDTGYWEVSISLPSDYWESCLLDSLLYVPLGSDSAYLDFPIQTLYECPLMSVNIQASWRMRPCMPGLLSVVYCNQGSLPAADAYVEITFDNDLAVTGSSIPWSVQQGNTYTFPLGTTPALSCGNFTIDLEMDCGAVMGSVKCVLAHIFPDSLCNFPALNWDGSNIVADGACSNDTVTFQLQNSGTGNMSQALNYRVEIVNDDIVMLMQADTFQLSSGETLTVQVPSLGLATRLVADQAMNHPLAEHISNVVAGCAEPITDSIFNAMAQVPLTDRSFYDRTCIVVSASFDPNDKQALPTGIGDGHLVEPDWRLDYLIRFQNTGTDTAFKVLIQDTLSPFLDPASVRPGPASHPYTWDLSGEGVLTFTFDDIMLPDSNVNEPASHGFISFNILLDSGIAPGTIIENTAHIYFDFNDPVPTNTVFHQVKKPVTYGIGHLSFCGPTNYNNIFIANDTMLLDTLPQPLYDSLSITNLSILPTYEIVLDTVLDYGEPFFVDTSFTLVLVAANGCDSLVTVNVVVLSSIVETKLDRHVLLAPNPAHDQVLCIWDKQEIEVFEMNLLDATGKEIRLEPKQSLGFSPPCKIDISTSPAGVYLFKLSTNKGMIAKKLILF